MQKLKIKYQNYIALLSFAILLIISSCQRLDSNLFNADNSITEYKWDNYEGEVDFVLDESYDIPSSKMNLFSLLSKGEANAKIYTLYIGDTTKINTDTVILYCHGNRDHMDFYWQRAKLLAHVGGKNHFGVLMFDYRGFGMSEGTPTENDLYIDTETVLQWLKSKGLENSRLIVYGFSLGSAPATEICANNYSLKPSKLILEAPFASSEVMVQDGALLALPSPFFTNLKIDNANKIKNVQQPFFWIHGINDSFLSMKTHGEVIYKNYNGIYKDCVLVEGADHGEIPEKLDFVEYVNCLQKFIWN